MTTQTDSDFEFLNPLDGNRYTLPPYDKELFADKVTEFADTIPEIPDPWTMLTTLSPEEQEATIAASQERISLLRTMSVLSTLDNHLPAGDDPTKAAIIANVNASDFGFIWKVFKDWVAAAGEQVEDEPGEG